MFNSADTDSRDNGYDQEAHHESPYQDCVAPRINQHRTPGTDRLDEWAGGRKGRADTTGDAINGERVNRRGRK